MTFYERFEELCYAHGYKPTEAKLAEDMNNRGYSFSRSIANKWKSKPSALPNADKAIAIAEFFEVSLDYVFCRTDDPTDYSKGKQDLTQEERDLLSMFRTLNPEQRKMILTMVEPLFEQAKKVSTETA